MKTARFIKNLEGWRGDARLYELSEPAEYDYIDFEVETGKTKFVAVSAISSAPDTGLPETYIFPCDEDGNILSWLEMEGSFQGGMDHERALNNAGFTVIE